MGRIEHVTTQQIIGEWGSVEKFASSNSISPASTKMVIYIEGARSLPVEKALSEHGYLSLLNFEKELKRRNKDFRAYVKETRLSPIDLIDTLRGKKRHRAVRARLEKDGFWPLVSRPRTRKAKPNGKQKHESP